MVDNSPDELRADGVDVTGEAVGLEHASGGEACLSDVATVYGSLRPMAPGLVANSSRSSSRPLSLSENGVVKGV